MARYTRLLFCIFLISLIYSCKPRCPIASCATRKVHKHGQNDYRGQPFYKKQNPKIGEKLGKVPKEKHVRHNDKANYKK